VLQHSPLLVRPLLSPLPIPDIHLPADVVLNKRNAAEEDSTVPQEWEGAQRMSSRRQHARQRRRRRDSSPLHSAGWGACSPGSAAEDDQRRGCCACNVLHQGRAVDRRRTQSPHRRPNLRPRIHRSIHMEGPPIFR
jgi:hypothetical protein